MSAKTMLFCLDHNGNILKSSAVLGFYDLMPNQTFTLNTIIPSAIKILAKVIATYTTLVHLIMQKYQE